MPLPCVTYEQSQGAERGHTVLAPFLDSLQLHSMFSTFAFIFENTQKPTSLSLFQKDITGFRWGIQSENELHDTALKKLPSTWGDRDIQYLG